MLRIYDVILEVLGMLRPVIVEIEKHDRDLARQLRRAATSMALNCCEGSGSRGGTRRERYDNALGSARETGGCVDSARRWAMSSASIRCSSTSSITCGPCS